jgi:RimJ/RimL family protein N-acetyltransferase
MKVLMIDHCFACGMSAIELRVDTRNGRSIRAIEKLGAVLVETLRANMATWTGHVRDTAIYRLSRAEWARHRS